MSMSATASVPSGSLRGAGEGAGAVSPADTGMHGPDSVTWQLHADPAMWVGGIRSLYLQALHPRTVAGVVQNSDFQRDPLGRLARTGHFVAVGTYGTGEQVRRAAERVRGIHRGLRGVDPETGETFRLDEPELLLWVHCAEVASFLDVVRLAGFELSNAQADRYLDEQRGTATLVGLHAEEVPGSVRAMAGYFAAMRPRLRAGADAEAIYRYLHRPPVTGRLRAGLPAYEALLGHVAYSLLPRWAVRMYGYRRYPLPVATSLLRAARSAALCAPRTTPFVGFGPQVWEAIRRLGPEARPSARRLPPG